MLDLAKHKLNIVYHGLSDIGLVRSENQDSYGIFPPGTPDLYSGGGYMFVVADGVGGHAGGKEASSTAVETISNYFFNSRSTDASNTLKEAIEAANTKIYQNSIRSEKFSRMATTSTVLVLKEQSAIVGHVGDSRVYKVEKNIIEQLTREHTQLNEMLKEGLLNEKEAKDFPRKSVLSRALGANDKIEVDIIDNIILKDGQSFILCSDGLSKVSKEEILGIVNGSLPDVSCEKLIRLANERGGKDNVTVIVVKITASKKNISKAASSVSNKRLDKAVQTPVFSSRNTNKKIKKNGTTIVLSVIIFFFIIILLFGSTILEMINSFTESTVNSSPTPEEVITNREDKELETANQLFKKGSYKKALVSYQDILTREPLHVGALDGVNKIVVMYNKKAEELRNNNDYKGALIFYQEIEAIKPGQEEIKRLITLCKNKIESARIDSTVRK